MVMYQRKLDTLTYSASGTSTIDVPKEHWHKKILLNFIGQCDSGSAVSKSAYNPFEIVKLIELVGNGSKVIKRISGKSLYLRNIYEHGTVPERNQTPASTSQSNQAFGGSMYLYLDKDKDMNETLLPGFAFDSLQLRITWGAATDIDSGSGFAVDNLYCYPLLTEELRTPKNSDTSGKAVLVENEIVKTLTQSGWIEIDLPRENVYNNFSILARDNTAASNTIISEYEVVRNGHDVLRSAKFGQSRAEDLVDYSLEAANQPTGYTIVDFELGGGYPLESRGLDSLKLRLNVSTTPTATADVTIHTEELMLPR